MSDTWQTIEQAAVTLGLSVRTVNRHITAGKLESRLFEGRREVRVSMADTPAGQSAPVSVTAQTSSAPSGRSGSSNGNGWGHNSNSAADMVAEATTPQPSESTINFVINAKPDSARDEARMRESASGAAHSDTSSSRQHVTAELVSDKPMDLQTMLALTDSIDDKATLAVSAYQTLARSAETQVQSLRKVAFGAWAVVGVMAMGIIVAVGWATYRLTSAEVTAGHLQEQVTKQNEELRRLSQDRETSQERIAQMREQAAKLQTQNEDLERQANQAKATAAEQRDAMARLAASVIPASATRPTTAPSASAVGPAPAATATVGQASPASPSTRPSDILNGTPGSVSPPGYAFTPVAPASRPTTHPVAKAPTPQNPRTTYSTNSNEAFDPK